MSTIKLVAVLVVQVVLFFAQTLFFKNPCHQGEIHVSFNKIELKEKSGIKRFKLILLGFFSHLFPRYNLPLLFKKSWQQKQRLLVTFNFFKKRKKVESYKVPSVREYLSLTAL